MYVRKSSFAWVSTTCRSLVPRPAIGSGSENPRGCARNRRRGFPMVFPPTHKRKRFLFTSSLIIVSLFVALKFYLLSLFSPFSVMSGIKYTLLTNFVESLKSRLLAINGANVDHSQQTAQDHINFTNGR